MSHSSAPRSTALSKSSLPIGWLFLMCLGVIGGAVWHHIGFSHQPLFEDWGYVASFERNDYYVDHVPTRILRVIPHAISYHIDPNSQLGNNLLLFLIFLSRGLFTYWIFRRIFPKRYLLAMVTALLTMVYPIGTGYFTARALEGNFAWSMALLSIALVLTYWRKPRKWLWLLIWLTQIVSLLCYELLYLPALFVPAILFWAQEPPRRFNAYWRKTSLLWLSVNCLFLSGYAYLTVTGQNNYISDQANSRDVSLRHLPQYIDNIGLMYRLHAVEWQDASQLARNNILGFGGLWLILTIIFWLVARHEKQRFLSTRKFSLGEIASGLLGGLIWMGLGFAIFVPIAHIVALGFRLYFASGIGAAWIIALSLTVLREYIPRPLLIVPIAGMALFVSLGALQMHAKNLDYAEDAWASERLWSTLIEQVPDLPDDAQIVVIDEGHYYHNSSFQGFPNVVLNFGMNYLYQEERLTSFCVLEPSISNQCIFYPDHLEIKRSRFGITQQLDYAKVVIFTVFSDGQIILLEAIPPRLVEETVPNYQPHDLIQTDAEPPDRAFTFLQCFPVSKCKDRAGWLSIQQTASVQFDFHEAMNYPGWEAQPRQGEWLWTVGTQAFLPLYLEHEQAYILQIRANALDESVFNDVSIRIDQHDAIPLGWEYIDGGIALLQAYIPADMIPDYLTVLEIDLGTRISLHESGLGDDSRELGLNVDQVSIEPVSQFSQTAVTVDFAKPIYGRHWVRFREDVHQRWMLGNLSEIDVWLEPHREYTIRFEAGALTPDVLEGAQLYINGQVIDLEAEVLADNYWRFTGTIPADLVQNELLTLQFRTDQTVTPQSLGINDDIRPLALRLGVLEIKSVTTHEETK